jgi:hypothetical protein
MSIAEAERLDPFGKGGKINPLLCILQQALPRVILENLRIPNVAPERVHALVARLIGHLED